ncbi:hypothetical protein SD80_028040 [Scytonema tolypothrichoides VB-61278]|nr:hypothetical protein SD80_028040 [Scytonema tolypothrichoides VB-61278]
MLKHLMLSGWFRAQPFVKYLIFVMLIAPLMAASEHTTSAQQVQVAKVASATKEPDSIAVDPRLLTTAAVDKANFVSVPKAAPIKSSTEKSHSIPMSLGAVSQPQTQIDQQTNKNEALTVKDSSASVQMPYYDQLPPLELPPALKESESASNEMAASQHNLVQRLKASKVIALAANNGSASGEVLAAKTLEAVKIDPFKEGQQKSTAVLVVEQPGQQASKQQQDPIGSPHPIPWTWIQATQDAIGSKGLSGVRYYRSMPVISADGRYAMYSRVQLEVKPQMYNTRVTSVLFVEDRQTKKLRVVSSTGSINDPLLKVQVSSASDAQGTIAVLVPVSWSQKGDRFLARKFEGAMNTSDVTDYALIWDREQNRSESVTPSQEEYKHEIAVLLGWSKTHPDQVVFRAGELGQEEWPLMTVGYDGKTVAATTTEQPVVYGKRVTDVWAEPQVAYR